MGDVADILGMGRQTSQSDGDGLLAPTKEKPKGAPTKKPKGMSREVFALIGPDGMAPNVVAKKAAFKEKREGVAKTLGRWVWTTFKNSGRKDGAEIFYHWTKAAVEFPDYQFARFNIVTPAINFTEEEYKTHLNDADWTSEETRALCELVERFDRRWPVIMDRYPHETYKKERTVEDLQRRYYHVYQTIRVTRHASGAPQPQLLPLGLDYDSTTESFDLYYERKRRHQLELLFKRTKQEEEEETALREELKTIDQALKKVKKHPVQKSVAREPPEAREVALTDPALAVPEKSIQEARPDPRPGQPYLQSARLSVPVMPPRLSNRMLTKVRNLLADLGLPPRPIPTKTVCDLYDDMRRDMVELFTVQKAVKQKEAQMDAIRQGEDQTQVFNRNVLGGQLDAPRGGPGSSFGAAVQKGGPKRPRPQAGRHSLNTPGLHVVGGGYAPDGSFTGSEGDKGHKKKRMSM